jgi:ribosomal protein L11 methyltransferase
MSNDEQIPHDLWTVRLNFQRVLMGELPEKLSAALEDMALSVFLHNKEATDGDNWELTLTTLGKPDVREILRRVEAISRAENLPALLSEKDIVAEKLKEKDWLRHVHENFPPVRIGQFFVYGSHYKGKSPEETIPLKIDAATAFGSGEHETTQGCVLSLEKLKKAHAFKNGLDMGCGSGILAIAFLKLWPQARMTAVDIDPESITVTGRHAIMNGVEDRIAAMAGDGYKTPLVAKNAPYDLITANILAGPLIGMAPALASVLKPGGFAVLSGLLKRQGEDVLAAHQKEGLRLVRIEEIGEWQALVLQK